MQAEDDHPWALAEFGRCLKEWKYRDAPDETLRDLVLDWIVTRRVDPYRGVVRAPDFANLWYGTVPGSEHGDKAVLVTYWIVETAHQVNGESIATLSAPII